MGYPPMADRNKALPAPGGATGAEGFEHPRPPEQAIGAADKLLRKTVTDKYEAGINRCAGDLMLYPNEKDVLIELAYVTNQQDAQNLRSDSWRDKVSNSLVTAIHNYFTHQVAQLPF